MDVSGTSCCVVIEKRVRKTSVRVDKMKMLMFGLTMPVRDNKAAVPEILEPEPEPESV